MTTDKASNPLQAQVLAAQDEIQTADRAAALKDVSRGSGKRGRRLLIAAVSCVAFFVVLAWNQAELRYWLTTPSTELLQADLESTVAQAAREIDDFRDINGRLPDTLPNPALALLVQYQREDDDHYELSASIGSVSIERRY